MQPSFSIIIIVFMGMALVVMKKSVRMAWVVEWNCHIWSESDIPSEVPSRRFKCQLAISRVLLGINGAGVGECCSCGPPGAPLRERDHLCCNVIKINDYLYWFLLECSDSANNGINYLYLGLCNDYNHLKPYRWHKSCIEIVLIHFAGGEGGKRGLLCLPLWKIVGKALSVRSKLYVC